MTTTHEATPAQVAGPPASSSTEGSLRGRDDTAGFAWNDWLVPSWEDFVAARARYLTSLSPDEAPSPPPPNEPGKL
jgi:hypothetical protein